MSVTQYTENIRCPNITGSFIAFGSVGGSDNAFYQGDAVNNFATGNYSQRYVHLNAYDHNSIYGASSTVQAPAYQALIIIKD